MRVIADSGSTKTDWVLIDDGGSEQRFQTIGLNPFFSNTADVTEALTEGFPLEVCDKVDSVWFYGAGCSSLKRNLIVENGIKAVLSNATIHIQHDLIGAARALFFDEPGIVCILGTGSNTCYFDGKEIVKNVPALGYVLGDEGSGSRLGKEVVRAYLYGELPDEINQSIEKEHGLNKEVIFDKVYSQPLPNRFLASLAPICSEFITTPEMQKLVHRVFDEFIDRLILKYSDYKQLPVGVIGSVGLAFEPLLSEKLSEKGFRLEKSIKKPIDSLLKYHKR